MFPENPFFSAFVVYYRTLAGLRRKVGRDRLFSILCLCVLSLANACIIEGRLFSAAEWNLGKKETLHLTPVMALDYQTHYHPSTPLLSPPNSSQQGLSQEYVVPTLDSIPNHV